MTIIMNIMKINKYKVFTKIKLSVDCCNTTKLLHCRINKMYMYNSRKIKFSPRNE